MSVEYDKLGMASQIIHSHSYGILSTLSVDMEGFPFGSVVPYMVDTAGELIILISDIAQHTKNIKNDNRVSMTIVQPSKTAVNVQSRGRVTFLARASPIEDKEYEAISKQYSRYFPESTSFFEAHGFRYYRLHLERIRFIGGFGKIFWLDRDEYISNHPLSLDQQEGVIKHMNEDHQEAMRKYFRIYKKVDVEDTLEFVGIHTTGCDILHKREKYHFTFPKPIASFDEVRSIFKDLGNNE
ncbi:MAG: DUF2470 domain-containing protein [Candidatus Heimdallarchaeota archaeon]|nr:DUF2470 domain-containing protein [Candidatus Heimdallarchaeota archaeon]